MKLTWANPTGGLGYHFAALVHSQGLWLPFRNQLSTWLNDWPIATEELLLIGPSAGHCLPIPWLGSFARLRILEPDPISRLWLRRRLKPFQVRLEFAPFPFGIEQSNSGNKPRFDFGKDSSGRSSILEFLGAHPKSPALFCNVLGQIPFAEGNLPDFEQKWNLFAESLALELRSRSWASIHDRISSSEEPARSFLESPKTISDEELVATFWGSNPIRPTFQTHLTDVLFKGETNANYTKWTINRKQHHVIEFLKNLLNGD